MHEIEVSTYSFNNYDKEIIRMLEEKYKLSKKKAVLTIKKLLQHQGIYTEFVNSLTSEKYPDKNNAIIIEGYNAETLEKDYSLSMLGAYNCLIYLREMPEEALKNLKDGLPRK